LLYSCFSWCSQCNGATAPWLLFMMCYPWFIMILMVLMFFCYLQILSKHNISKKVWCMFHFYRDVLFPAKIILLVLQQIMITQWFFPFFSFQGSLSQNKFDYIAPTFDYSIRLCLIVVSNFIIQMVLLFPWKPFF